MMINIGITVGTSGRGTLAPVQMATATFIDPDTADVLYTSTVDATKFTASDFLDSTQPATPSSIAQQDGKTLRLTSWDNPIAQNDHLAYTGHASGISSPQTINID